MGCAEKGRGTSRAEGELPGDETSHVGSAAKDPARAKGVKQKQTTVQTIAMTLRIVLGMLLGICQIRLFTPSNSRPFRGVSSSRGSIGRTPSAGNRISESSSPPPESAGAITVESRLR